MLTRILHRIVAKPWVFDRVQELAGYGEICRQVGTCLPRSEGKILLDVGGGTGAIGSLLPPGTTYLWMDNDREKLAGYRTRQRADWAVLGDAARLCLRDKSVDYAVCISVAHHLTDEQLQLVLRALSRVVRDALIFVDPVKNNDASSISRLLWRYDRGSHPRSEIALCAAIEPWFRLEEKRSFAVYHRYLLCVGSPR